jgi:MFS family permease
MSTNTSTSRNALRLTFVLMLFGFGSISSSRVLLSLYALDLGASARAVGFLVAALYVCPLLMSWPVGRYADRVGSRGLLLGGAASGACAMLIPFFVRHLAALYVSATLMGVAFTLYNVLLPNIVGVVSRPEERPRNFSNASLVGATTLFAGPLLAGFAIDLFGHPIACLMLVTFSVGAATLVLLWGDLLPVGSSHVAPSGGVRENFTDPAMRRILATSGLVQVGQDLFQFYIPVYGHAIGLSASAIGAVLAALAVASFVVRFALPHLIAKLGEDALLGIAFYFTAVAFLLVPFVQHMVTLALIAFVFGLGIGCGQPITTMLIFSRCAEGRTGETLGLRQTVNNAMRVSGPAVFGAIASMFGLSPVFWISAAMMGGGGLLMRTQRAK